MILAITNLKGGVGKTTTATALAAGLAQRGQRVLLIDGDPQGSASLALGTAKDTLASPSTADVLLAGQPAAACIRPSGWANLDLLTGSLALADADLQLAAAPDRAHRLRDALAPLRARYDTILIDCPPGLGLVVINALVAANGCLVPVEPHHLALEGMVNLEAALTRLRAGMGTAPPILAIVLVRVDRRPTANRDIIDLIRHHYGRLVCRVEIPVNTRLAEAPSHGRPITAYAPASTGGRAYDVLTTEIARRMKHGVIAR